MKTILFGACSLLLVTLADTRPVNAETTSSAFERGAIMAAEYTYRRGFMPSQGYRNCAFIHPSWTTEQLEKCSEKLCLEQGFSPKDCGIK